MNEIIIIAALMILCTICILVAYLVIVLINKKLKLDMNGHPIKEMEQQVISPIINIDGKMLQRSNIVEEEPKKEKVDPFVEDIPFLKNKKAKDIKIETSFNNKRLGKQGDKK